MSRLPTTRRSDRGSISVFFALITMPLLLLTALVINGYQRQDVAARAEQLAAEAARAGTTAISIRSDGETVDLLPAQAAVDTYLADSGATGHLEAAGPWQLRVTVTLRGQWWPTDRSYTETGEATAQLRAPEGSGG